MSPRKVSPAAAAAVSRALSGAGIKRATEVRKGIELEGYWAEPNGDHVRVDYVPHYWIEPEDARPFVVEGIAQCKSALRSRYDVTEVERDVIYGGNPAISLPVLEVRRAAWTQR